MGKNSSCTCDAPSASACSTFITAGNSSYSTSTSSAAASAGVDVVSNDDRHDVALVPHLVHCHERNVAVDEAVHLLHVRVGAYLVAREHADDAGHRPRHRGVQRDDARVGQGTAHDLRVRHARARSDRSCTRRGPLLCRALRASASTGRPGGLRLGSLQRTCQRSLHQYPEYPALVPLGPTQVFYRVGLVRRGSRNLSYALRRCLHAHESACRVRDDRHRPRSAHHDARGYARCRTTGPS